MTALNFSWFPKQMPKAKLIVINQNHFETEHIIGMDLEAFLLNKNI